MQVNSMLREQLEQANVANAALSEDIRKLTADWARARDELEQREAEWRREEEVWGRQGSHRGQGEGCGDVAWKRMWGWERDAGPLGRMRSFAWRTVWGCRRCAI